VAVGGNTASTLRLEIRVPGIPPRKSLRRGTGCGKSASPGLWGAPWGDLRGYPEKSRPPYPRQFREEAVRLARESGKSRARIAKDLGISEQALYTWLKQDELDSGKRTNGLTTEEHAEVRRLRREVRILREEREILRKAAAFFAKETNSTP